MWKWEKWCRKLAVGAIDCGFSRSSFYFGFFFTSLETDINMFARFPFAGVKRICFGHALDEDNMRFSCFPRAANILGKRGSINLTPLPGNDESNSIGNLSVVSLDSFDDHSSRNSLLSAFCCRTEAQGMGLTPATNNPASQTWHTVWWVFMSFV